MRQQMFRDAVVDATYYPIVFCTGALCLILFKFISPYVSGKLWSNYTHLPKGVRIDWGTRVVSTAHATTVSLMSAYAHLYDDDMHTHPVWWDCPLVRTACAVVIGYMVMDLILITIYFKDMGELEYYVHHSASIFAYYYVVSYGVMPYFANFRLLSEISTPFLNIRWFLLTIGVPKSSRTYIANRIVLLISFFFCRVLVIPFYWLKVFTATYRDDFALLGHTPLVLVLTCVILDSLNIYWFCKLFQGFLNWLPSLPIITRMGSRSSSSSSRSAAAVGAGCWEKRETDRVKSG
ncbi:TLC domain-containing protein 4-B-like [Babylonia areolata]|uniref:TLC domain-containing protein 4-B-like n=1 Tax=Babylonia areolata TaxID=304850 RepID=UPI003FD3EA73